MKWEDFCQRVDVSALRQAKTKDEFVRILRPGFPEFADRPDEDLLAIVTRYVPGILMMVPR